MLSERQRLVVHCITMRLHENEALLYLKGSGHEVSPATYYRIKSDLEDQKLKRLHDIALSGFVDQHLERIDQLETILKLMWENYHLETAPYKKVKILAEIAGVQPYLSAYYESTKSVLEDNAKMQKEHKHEALVRPESIDISKTGEPAPTATSQ